MLSDKVILYSSWIITLIGVFILMPKDRVREAMVVFMFKQLLTWIMGLFVVEFHLIEYPIRMLSRATTTSFSFEYIIYPALSVIFVLRFPENKPILYKIAWYLFFPSWMSAAEVLIEHNTNLIRYIHWDWYLTWLSLLVTFFFSRVYYLWFFRKRPF